MSIGILLGVHILVSDQNLIFSFLCECTERISKHPTRSCQLQLRSKYYDDVDESDIPFNDDDDEEDVDEDDSIFSPVKGKKYK